MDQLYGKVKIMLLNLSNHPVRGVWNPQKERYENAWSPEQISAAHEEFGEIIDEPFPMIPPEYSGEEVRQLAMTYLEKCKTVLGAPCDGNAVMLSGEIVFCSMLSRMLLDAGYRVICATTKRIVTDLGEGRIIKDFKFVKFREYGNIK